MSGTTDVGARAVTQATSLDRAIAAVATGADQLDRAPRFPTEAIRALADAGALSATVGAARAGKSVAEEWELVRRVAAADASVGRILDGHLNAIERLEVTADPRLRDRELERVGHGGHLLGVWGADPRPGEGPPARLHERDGALVVRGVKTFCSGAGGVDAALVAVGSENGAPPRLALVECAGLEIDRSWFRAAGLRASESHRVRFDDAPVLGLLGEPGELSREPWFSRDAMRTAASWAGMVDAAAEAALAELASRAEDPGSRLAAGRIEASRATVDAWIALATTAADAGTDPGRSSILMRAEIDRAAKTLLEVAASACGSGPFVRGGRLDRARRDLETFLLQHRLEPLLARIGAAGLGEG